MCLVSEIKRVALKKKKKKKTLKSQGDTSVTWTNQTALVG